MGAMLGTKMAPTKKMSTSASVRRESSPARRDSDRSKRSSMHSYVDSIESVTTLSDPP